MMANKIKILKPPDVVKNGPNVFGTFGLPTKVFLNGKWIEGKVTVSQTIDQMGDQTTTITIKQTQTELEYEKVESNDPQNTSTS